MTDLREQELLDIIENLTQENAYLKATIKHQRPPEESIRTPGQSADPIRNP